MSANSSTKPDARPSEARQYKWWYLLGLPLWVFSGFVLAQAVLIAIFSILRDSGVPFESIDSTVLDATFAAVVYILSMTIVIGVPWMVQKRRTSKRDVGLQRLPSWMDIGLAPAGFIVYLLISGLILYAVTQLIPGVDMAEPQEIGFDDLSYRYEYFLAFATLVVIAPVAEEVLFRGYLYGKLRKAVPLWAAMIATSVLFSLLHTQWSDGAISGLNVAFDVFALSIVMCTLREVTGSIWAGILLHMMKNGLAFYLLFINPSLLSTIGG